MPMKTFVQKSFAELFDEPYDRRRSARALAEKYELCKDYVWRIVTRRARKWRRG